MIVLSNGKKAYPEGIAGNDEAISQYTARQISQVNQQMPQYKAINTLLSQSRN